MLVGSTKDSLTFAWQSATSATYYRLVGGGVDNKNSSVNNITVSGLTPGSYYTFSAWAVSAQGLVSNNITCAGSTGTSKAVVAEFGKAIWGTKSPPSASGSVSNRMSGDRFLAAELNRFH